MCPSSQSISLMSVCHLFLVSTTCSPLKLAEASKWGYPSHWAETLGRGGRSMIVDTNNALSYLEESTLVTNPTHAHRHTHTHTCNWLHSQSQRGNDQGRILMIVFLFCFLIFCHWSQLQVNGIQKMYKIDVRAFVKTLYSQLSFAVRRMKWKSLWISPKSVYAVSARALGLAPTCHRFTQTRFCTLVSLSCPPTKQLVPQCQLTPCPSQFPKILHMMCWTAHGHHISSQTHSHSPNSVWLEVIMMSFQT